MNLDPDEVDDSVAPSASLDPSVAPPSMADTDLHMDFFEGSVLSDGITFIDIDETEF